MIRYNDMTQLLRHIIIFTAVICAATASAQTPEQVQLADGGSVDLPDARVKGIRGYYYTVVDQSHIHI